VAITPRWQIIKEDLGSISEAATTQIDRGVITELPNSFLDYGLIYYPIFPWPDYDVFPVLAGLGWSVTKAPEWKTVIHETAGGYEDRWGMWAQPRWKWTVTFEFLRADLVYYEFQALANFINRKFGTKDDFLFWDPTDNYAVNQVIGVGDGATTIFQMVRRMFSGGLAEPVFAVNNSINNVPAGNVIYLDGIPLMTDSGYVLGDDGMLTFDTPPASGVNINADFNYFWPARLADDENDFDYFMADLWEMKKLEILGLKMKWN
jgi:uncharacterized protein (TIGR02217 family)